MASPTALIATNPATGEVVRETPALDPAARDATIARVAAAAPAWRALDFANRARLLTGVAAKMREDRERLAKVMTVEMGKPIREARGEVDKSIWCAEHYAASAADYLAPELIASDATESRVEYPPLGTVLGILPWNAPFWLAFRFLAPALMAGNTCVMKHDPHVQGSALAIEAVFREVAEASSLPVDVVANLPLRNEDIEGAMRHPKVAAVSFTGSSRAGAIVASIAASEIKPAVLELGGSDPAIVLADADLDQAAEILRISRIINAGQSCIAPKRILVEAPVYEAFVERYKAQLAGLKLGDPGEESTDVGPIARSDLREILHRQVRETVDAGATCLLGGELPEGPGWFYPVTLLTDVTPDMTACTEETFGPVGVVLKVKDRDEALRLANDTPYGLAASVWSKDVAGAEALAREIEAGQVVINGIVKTDPRLPSGGIKRSGYGRELGPHGIREFVNTKQVWVGPKVG